MANYTKVNDVAEYKWAATGSEWPNEIPNSRKKCDSVEEAMAQANNIGADFFFFTNQPMYLEGNATHQAKGQFNPGDAVFFTGQPWWGSAPQCDGYIRESVTPRKDANWPNNLVFQRGSGASTQSIAYWAGSSKTEADGGGGGPVPNFGGVNQPAYVEIGKPGNNAIGSHIITYVDPQPIEVQKIFFSIIVNGDKDNPVGQISALLHKSGQITDLKNTCPASSQVVAQVIGGNGANVAVMMPATIPT